MKNVQIMLVEDERFIANYIKSKLEKMGYNVAAIVDSAENAYEALEMITPNLILMDIILKGKIDGIEAANHIKNNYDIPIIYVTSFDDETMLDRAVETEPFGFLQKPFEDKELHITVEMALYKHKMEMERKKILQELEKAMAKIQTLQGLLPICASCKKIRNDHGNWKSIESYIHEHCNAKFTHSVCPDCSKRLYPEIHNKNA